MYKNLETTLQVEGISKKDYGIIIGVSEKSVQNKINGTTDFTYPEFKKTMLLLRKYSSEYIFEETSNIS